ncbi:hypothetical protein HWV62_4838 [Athelia sp. TMB]|nr:hypothetical protein HWV62_4838 [Athelia sp. TMB]
MKASPCRTFLRFSCINGVPTTIRRTTPGLLHPFISPRILLSQSNSVLSHLGPSFCVYRLGTVIPCRITSFHAIVGTVTPSIVDNYKHATCHPFEATLCAKVHDAYMKLEQSARLALHALDRAQARGKASVVWSRAEMNILRKFLFVLGQRAGVHWRRYAHFSETGTGVLDEEVEALRKAHGLPNARCAWLLSLHSLIQTPHWGIPASTSILPRDRAAYEGDMRFRQLAIYETPHRGCDFLLTQSSLGLADGVVPASSQDDEFKLGQALNMPRVTGGPKKKGTLGVPLAKIYTVSPRLAIFLVHVELPTAKHNFDDSDLALPDLPPASTQVTYIPPLSPSAIAFSRKDPSVWTPEDIQRESDFRHEHILDGKVVYARLADSMEVAIAKLSFKLFMQVTTTILNKNINRDEWEWLVSPTKL